VLKRIILILSTLVLASGLVIGSLMPRPALATTGMQCPAGHYLGVTIHETYTWIPISAGPWVATEPLGFGTYLGINVGLGGVWTRPVTYLVRGTRRTISVCYSSLWALLWQSDGSIIGGTTEQLPTTTETKTQIKIKWPLTAEPPPNTLPEPFYRKYIVISETDPISISGVVGSTGWALEFPPMIPGDDVLVALAPGYDFGSGQFGLLADAFAGEPGLPPEASKFVADIQDISSGFAQVASELTAGVLTEGSMTSLAASLTNFQQDINNIGMLEYIPATPYLGQAANYLNDAALQVSLGLDSAEEELIFLQDLQSLGVSLVDCANAVEEPSEFYSCFVATAAYGTPMAPQIDVLREFRDQYLLTNPVGKALVEFYYKVSPPMAEFITEHPALKPIVRVGLVPAVMMSTMAVNSTSAEKMAILGSLALVCIALAIWVRERARRFGRWR